MSLVDKLEIILVTYNRKDYLENTLNSLFDDNSPVKNFNITILDNKSTDGTGELIQSFCAKFPNINHVINNRNIGGNANIAQAFAIANKDYVWVICDDDMYDWNNWHEVEKAINENHDVIVVDNESILYKNESLDVLFQLSFLPSGIYKTSILDNSVVRNIYDNIANWFPHLPVGISVINSTNDFYVLNQSIVRNGQLDRYLNNLELSEDSVVRDNNIEKIYKEQCLQNWHIAYIKSLSLLKGRQKDISKAISFALQHPPKGVGNTLYKFCREIVNATQYDNYCSNLFYDVYYKVDFRMKCILLFHKFFNGINPFYVTEKGLNIRVGKIKTRLIKWS